MWQRLDRPSLEFLQWAADHEVVLRGEVVGDIDGHLGRVRYRVRAGDDWLTRVVRIQLWSPSGVRDLRLWVWLP